MERRRFLATTLGAGAIAALGIPRAASANPERRRHLRPALPDPGLEWRGDSSLAAALRSEPLPFELRPLSLLPSPLPLSDRFEDLGRHLVFEYYPWYATDPWRHWEQWGRQPPDDLAASAMPRLGAYDSRQRRVIETHAAWIAESGVGAVNLSWWGPGSFEDQAIHVVMDVMHAHGLKVTFHIEPYIDERARSYRRDVKHLLREFGERRGFDAFLLLRDESGREGPVFKSFRTVLPESSVDCHGVERPLPDYTPDYAWAREIDSLREELAADFSHLTLLADSLDFGRVRQAGFDGVAIYDNFVPPEAYAAIASGASQRDLVFSLNVNPGYDGIEPRHIEPGSCYEPAPFSPPTAPIDWATRPGRELAAARARDRIRDSLAATVSVQSDPAYSNLRRGFFLTYVNSFNEWHEGHAFEPMKDEQELTAAENAVGYHNPERGDYRLAELRDLLRPLLQPASLRDPVAGTLRDPSLSAEAEVPILPTES